MQAMFSGGLVEETARILDLGYASECKPFESIGYKQALQVLRGDLSGKDALFYATRETRRYAKRQMTWFRQDPALEVFSGFGDEPATAATVEARVQAFLSGDAANA